ncbi:MAG: hypothetical protein V3S29_02235 [bacterium]
MSDEANLLYGGWAARPPGKRFEDGGPTLEAINRLMDGLLIPTPMKELVQIFLAKSILEPEAAAKEAHRLRGRLAPSKWRQAIEAERGRLR